MTSTLWLTLGVTAGAVLALLLATFGVALVVRRYNVVDVTWGLGFALIAAVAYGLSAGHGSDSRRALLLGATVLWGVRLAGYIGWRSRGKGEDPRYTDMLDKASGPRALTALRKIFLLQAALIWLISVPVQAGMFQRGGPTWLLYLGLAVWLCGLGFESVGDWQLARFKADPGRRGTVLDQGLWRYTRHPNYFGDACVWWGLFLISCSAWLAVVTVYSPLLMTFLLARGSGKPITEERMAARPGYADYVRRTSGFVPRPPRRSAAAR